MNAMHSFHIQSHGVQSAASLLALLCGVHVVVVENL